MTITEIKNLLQGEVSKEQLEELKADERKGVQNIASTNKASGFTFRP